jgi:DDE family transposase
MAWCERQRIGYIFGLAGNPVLLRQVGPLAEDAALGRLAGEGEKVRRYGDFRYAAKSWTVERRVITRVEAGPQGADNPDHPRLRRHQKPRPVAATTPRPPSPS